MKGKLNQVKIEQSFGKNKLQSKECSGKSLQIKRERLYKLKGNIMMRKEGQKGKQILHEIFSILQ